MSHESHILFAYNSRKDYTGYSKTIDHRKLTFEEHGIGILTYVRTTIYLNVH